MRPTHRFVERLIGGLCCSPRSSVAYVTRKINGRREYSYLTSKMTSSRPFLDMYPKLYVAHQNILRTARRNLFIQTESTPNPDSIKFLPGREVLTQEQAMDNRGFYATKADLDDIARSPLAKEIFKIDGIKSVYFGGDFITVTKLATAHWSHLRTFIFSAIMDFYSSNANAQALLSAELVTDTTILDSDDEVVAMIKELLETRIRPAVQEDGGDIRYIGFEPETGIVSVKLAGSCVGCPSSSVTLKNGVENMLMHYIPEVTAVHSIEDDMEKRKEENGDDVVVEKSTSEEKKTTPMSTYEQRLAAAGIPFSD